MKLFSPAWLADREETAQRAVALADERRAAKKACAEKGHLPGEAFVVPEYLNSAGMSFERCRRCMEWVRVDH